MIPRTGIIIAGGLSSRFSGERKALIHVGGRRILDYLYDVFRPLFDEIILVTNDPPLYLDWDVKIVSDLFDVRSSLTGIHAGLFYASAPHAFISACDTPFLKKELVMGLCDAVDETTDVVIPETMAGFEPLCAVYSRRCLETLERNLKRGQFKIQRCFKKMRVKKIPEATVSGYDPDLVSFFNINTPEDKARAEAMITRKSA